MLYSSAYCRIYGPISSRVTSAFLNTGNISAKCSRRSAGTRTSHSIIPNRVPSITAVRISFCVIFHFGLGGNFCFLLPLTFPHLDYLNVTSKIGCIFLCVIQQLCHRFTVQSIHLLWLVAISTTMKVATMELIIRTRFRAPAVDQELAYTLFSTNGLVSNIAISFKRYRRQPLRSHLSVWLRSLRTEPLLFTTTRIPSAWHILHQGP